MLIVHAIWDLVENLKVLLGTKMTMHIKFRDQNLSNWLCWETKMIINC